MLVNKSRAAKDEQGITRTMTNLESCPHAIAPFRPSFPSCPTPSNLRRHSHKELQRTQYVTDRDIQWHGEQPHNPDWSDTSRLVAFTLSGGMERGQGHGGLGKGGCGARRQGWLVCGHTIPAGATGDVGQGRKVAGK